MRVALAVALCVAGLAAPARADAPPPLPDEHPADADADAEGHSDFWEQALAPHRSDYDGKIARAEAIMRQTDARLYAEAEDLLREAIELSPTEPYAHWMLGDLYERQQKWQPCVDARTALFELDPAFHPTRGRSWELDSGLASCLAQTGDYESAIDHYKRILASSYAKGSNAHVYLGMTYMALGRVDDAIATYEAGIGDLNVNPRSRLTPLLHFAAAVAYDRNGMSSAAAEQISQGLRIDRTLGVFGLPEARFAPPEEELYYRGLAEAGRERDAWAIAYFRQYLAAAGDRAWKQRAGDHLEQLTRRGFDPRHIRLTGSAVMDRKKVQAAIARHVLALHACMQRAPNVLFDVRITVIAPGKALANAAIAPKQAGVHVRQQLGFDTDTVDVLAAQSCVEKTARSIALPKPSGSARSFATVELWLVAR